LRAEPNFGYPVAMQVVANTATWNGSVAVGIAGMPMKGQYRAVEKKG
jgi:hypothetical protein